MGQRGVRGRWTTWLVLALAAMAASCVVVPSAGAVVVPVSKHQDAGVAPVRGVSSAALRASLGATGFRIGKSSGAAGLSTNGNLDYNGGSVLHGVSPYLIFWDPAGQISSADKALFARYFADAAHDSGSSTNVFAVDRQFTDSTGFANYSQAWSSSHAITDTDPYPSAASQCTENSGFTETACLFDSQLQDEVQHLITADGLPSGFTGSAPIYFVVTPPTVNSCFGDDSTCADNFFCAYHSQSSSNTFLYADIPTLLAENDPKGCQVDGHSNIQSPNGNPLVDVAIKYMSHEDNETITDPVPPNGWVDNATGQEDGDNCNFTGPFDPGADDNPNAFLPTLGGSAGAGTLYDQLMNGNKYYTQSEWSNGDVNCEMQPTASALTPVFSAPTVVSMGSPVSLNPSGSSAAGTFSSTTWDFGDGSSHFSLGAPATVSHTFTAPGTFQAKLTVVDDFGNLATVSHQITTPLPAFTSSPSTPQSGTSVNFDGTGSSEPSGTISSYSWNFGDGSSLVSGATPSHTFAAPGVYTVALTVTDNTSHTATITHTVTVHGLPSAAFSVTTVNPVAGSPVSFDGSASSESEGTIASYSWDFGDGSALASGATPSHIYAAAGTYTVKLKVTDGFGNTSATTSHSVAVASVPAAVISVQTPHPGAGDVVSFSGASSTDTGSTITGYAWNFGDGATSTLQNPTHAYTTPGVYTVSLTITDVTLNTSTTTQSVTIHGLPTAAFSVTTARPTAGSPVSFNGSASSEPFGPIASYQWNFGDGSSGSGATPSHSYAQAGTYTAKLTVTDASSNTASTTRTVVVVSTPTAVIATSGSTFATGVAVALSGAGSTDVGSSLSSYTWAFGDGAGGSGPAISHVYSRAGTYGVRLTVVDASGATSAITKTIVVTNARITHVAVKKSKTVERLTVTASGPGSVRLGKKRFSVTKPGSITIKVRLSAAQRRKLAAGKTVKLSLKLSFVPKAGTKSSSTVRIKIKG